MKIFPAWNRKSGFILSFVIILILLSSCSSPQAVQPLMTVLQAKTLPDAIADAPQAVAVSQDAQPEPMEAPAAKVAAPENQPASEAQAEPEVQVAQQAEGASAEQNSPAAEVGLAQASIGSESAAAIASGPAPSVEPSVGHTAPDFALNTLNGSQMRLSDLKGKNVLINYWVTWCIPCMEEMPTIQKLYQEYAQKGLMVVSVNGIAQDELDKVTQTVTNLGLTYPIVLDENDTIYKSYWVSFLPTSFFIDEQGVIRHIKLGGASEEELRIKLDQLLADQL